jgi:hypothetical protein
MPDLRTECKEQVKNFELRSKKTLTVKAIEVTPNSWTTNIGGSFLCQSTVVFLKSH